MKRIIFFLLVAIFYCSVCSAQSDTGIRSQLSLMVIPYSSAGEDILHKYENDESYRIALAGINTALMKMGYTNLLDCKEHKKMVDDRIKLRVSPEASTMKSYIEAARSDVFIEAEIGWSSPSPSDPSAHQARLILKAVDRYNATVYANNAGIKSSVRAFSGLPQAVEHTLSRDGLIEFNNFLQQLDRSYALLLEKGRPMKVRLETDVDSNIEFDNLVGNELLSDHVNTCLKEHAFKKNIQLIGEHPHIIEYNVFVAVLDSNGHSNIPAFYIRNKLSNYLRPLGLDVKYELNGTWLHCRVMKLRAQTKK